MSEYHDTQDSGILPVLLTLLFILAITAGSFIFGLAFLGTAAVIAVPVVFVLLIMITLG